jgi:hypothetical protein
LTLSFDLVKSDEKHDADDNNFLSLIDKRAHVSPSSWVLVNPSEWNDKYEKCNGENQSPINIETNKTVYNKNLKGFQFINYDTIFTWDIIYDGYSGYLC